MMEATSPELRKGVVTVKGNPVSLIGPELRIGDRAPEFVAVDTGMQPVQLSDFSGKVVLISVTPSVDTSVCDLQARRFNEIATGLADDVVVLNISMDLPTALARWCAASGSERIKAVSDYQTRGFGLSYGVLVDETKLLARSVWIVDREGIIRYRQIVPEITTEPDYDQALRRLQEILS